MHLVSANILDLQMSASKVQAEEVAKGERAINANIYDTDAWALLLIEVQVWCLLKVDNNTENID